MCTPTSGECRTATSEQPAAGGSRAQTMGGLSIALQLDGVVGAIRLPEKSVVDSCHLC